MAVRTRTLSLLLAVVAVQTSLAAQSAPSIAPRDKAADMAAVRSAALDYVEGFYEGDSIKLARSVRPEVYKYGFFVPQQGGAYQGQQMTWAGFFGYARSVRAANRPVPANAPKDIVVYEVLDQTASAKLTASWGIDYLLMAKFDGKWMITHVLWQTPPR